MHRADDVALANMRALRDNPIMYCPPGDYVRLSHKLRGCVMSNTPMEVRTAREAYYNATGSVLINGLGLGMVLEGILSKDDVTKVRVIEHDPDVISLVGPHFRDDPRVMIIHDDAFVYQSPKGERFDYVWHDIWDDISGDNLAAMAKLNRKYGSKADRQGTWSREVVRADARRYG